MACRCGEQPLRLLAGAVVCAALVAPAAGAVASTATTVKPAKQPPFYRGEAPPAGNTGRLPVTLSLPPGMPESWLPRPALVRLAAEMDAWLEEHQPASLLALADRGPRAAPPAVYLGCALEIQTDECSEEERANVLAVTRADPSWRASLGLSARGAGVEHALVVRLEVAPHWIRQKGLKGSKQIPLGTDHVQELPWLTSLDTPVWVLQVTGVVVDAEGEVLRSGAEGIWALRTPFRASPLGAQKLLSEADVEHVRTELRRGELPGAPLSWQVALTQLTRQLLAGD
jgi:hypothetical protein